MGFEWDPANAKLNFRNHRVRFEEATAVFDYPYAVMIADEAEGSEERLVGVGVGALGRVLVVVYTYRGDNIRPSFPPGLPPRTNALNTERNYNERLLRFQ